MGTAHLKIVAVLFSLVALAGCGSLFPKSFDPVTGRSVLVFVDRQANGANVFLFRKIDRALGQFTGPASQGMLYAGSYWQMRNGATRDDIIFSVMSNDKTKSALTYEPGDYAFVAVENYTAQGGSWNGYGYSVGGSNIKFVCLQGGAPTFTMRPGEITIVPVGNLPLPPAELAAEFANIRAKYPEMQGESKVAAMAPKVAFGSSAPMDRASCLGATQFTLVQ